MNKNNMTNQKENANTEIANKNVNEKKPINMARLMKRTILVLVANMILGCGTTVLRLSSMGTDPFTCMNLGVSAQVGLTYGTFLMILNIVLFIPCLIFKPRSFGLGAFANMILLGYWVDFLMGIFAKINITPESLIPNMPMRIVLMLLGVLFVCIGVGLYVECDMGAAPYDVMGIIVEEKTRGKVKFKWFRVATDILCIAIGFFTGSIVGVGTIVIGFFTGPVVSMFRKNIFSKWDLGVEAK